MLQYADCHHAHTVHETRLLRPLRTHKSSHTLCKTLEQNPSSNYNQLQTDFPAQFCLTESCRDR